MKLTDNVIVQRAISETPPFWRKVRNILGGVGVVAIIASKIPAIPDPWRSVIGEIGKILTAVGATAQFTTTDQSISKK